MDEDVGIVQMYLHLLLVGDKQVADVAAIELHAFHDVEFRVQALVLFHGDHAFLAHLLHRSCDHAANLVIAVGR